jgi:hypothetical protein
VDDLGQLVFGPQEDIAVLLAALGAPRADHLNDPEHGTSLRFEFTRSELRGAGIIASNPASWPRTCAPWGDPGAVCPAVRAGQTPPEEKDFFRFLVEAAGTITVRIDTINQDAQDTAANLDAEIELWRKADGVWTPLKTMGDQPAGELSGRLIARTRRPRGPSFFVKIGLRQEHVTRAKALLGDGASGEARDGRDVDTPGLGFYGSVIYCGSTARCWMQAGYNLGRGEHPVEVRS